MESGEWLPNEKLWVFEGRLLRRARNYFRTFFIILPVWNIKESILAFSRLLFPLVWVITVRSNLKDFVTVEVYTSFRSEWECTVLAFHFCEYLRQICSCRLLLHQDKSACPQTANYVAGNLMPGMDGALRRENMGGCWWCIWRWGNYWVNFYAAYDFENWHVMQIEQWKHRNLVKFKNEKKIE